MSDYGDVSDTLIDAVIIELPNDAHRDRVALEQRQRAVKVGCAESRPPQVDSNDDFVVAPEIASLIHRLQYSK